MPWRQRSRILCVVVTVVLPSIWNHCFKDTWSWRTCHQLHHKYGGSSASLWVFTTSQPTKIQRISSECFACIACIGRWSIAPRKWPASFWRPSDEYIYALSSAHIIVRGARRAEANGHKSKTLVQRARRTSNEWRQTTAHKPFFQCAPRAFFMRSPCVTGPLPATFYRMFTVPSCR